MPERYHGLVLKTTDRIIPQVVDSSAIVEEEDEVQEIDPPAEPVKALEQVSSFDELLVWGHDQVPATDDAFVKGVQEWISFAEAIHTTPKSSNCNDKSDNATP